MRTPFLSNFTSPCIQMLCVINYDCALDTCVCVCYEQDLIFDSVVFLWEHFTVHCQLVHTSLVDFRALSTNPGKHW